MATPISVIVPLHNRADLAAQCLAALARWTTALEIIVVDDGSTDPGVDLLQRAGLAHHWLRNPVARGFSAAVNRGLALATGETLLLLNSDAEVTAGGDLVLRQALARAAASSDLRPGADLGIPPGAHLGAVAARLVFPDGRPQWSGGSFPSLLWLFALASGLGRDSRSRVRKAPPSGFAGGAVDWAPGAALAIARSAWSAVGPFDESYRHYAQDLDYCQRLAAAGFTVRVLADWTVVHHLGGSLGPSSGRPSGPASAEVGGHDGQRLDLLWLDLLLWARRHRSAAWARQARRRLLLGGRVRQLMLALRRGSSEALAVAAAIAAIRARDA